MKKLVFSFGRFNPPTTGHEVLLKKVVAVAKKENADAMVYSSQSNDPKKNPLPYKEKTKFMKAMFPKHKKVIQYDVGVKNAFDTLSTVYAKGYRDVTMVVGSDRVTEFEKILNKYNDVEGRHGYYNFESGVKVVSAGARDPDAEGVTGMSASKMRAAAAANDFESFEKGMPAGFKGGQSVFDAVRKGMNLSEEMMEFMESDIEGLREFFETDLVNSLGVISDVELFESLNENVLGRYATAARAMTKRDDAAKAAVRASGGKDPRTNEPTTPEEWMARREYHLKYAARKGMTQPMKDLISKKTMGIHKKSASECREIHNIITGTKMDTMGNWKPNEKFAVREYPHSTPDHITREYRKKKEQYRKRLKSLQTSELEDTKDLKSKTEKPWYAAMKKHFASHGYISDVPKPDPLDFGITWKIGSDGQMPHRPYMESVQNGLIGLDQIKKFESVVDKLFAKYNIDFNFTRHFGDRMDDSRNNPSITLKELAEFIKKMYKRQGKSIKGVAGAEAILKDIQSDLNIPVAVTYDRNNDEFDVVLKTIMRKKNFTSPDKVIKYEENDMNNQLPEGFMEAVKQDSDVEDKKGSQPSKYYAADADGDKMSKSTKEKRAAYFAKGGSKKSAPGDKGAKTKESEHTKKYRQMFGETKPCWDGYTQQGMKKKGGKMVPNCVPEETVNEEKIDGLVKKSEKSGISYGILKKVYDRGMAAWKSGHRPGTTAQQWAFARVNSFVTKGKGTWGKADKDLAAKVKSESLEYRRLPEGFMDSLAERDYKKERKNYLGTPEQMERNAGRSRARRLAIKKGMAERGDGRDIHHKDRNPLNNDPKNLSSVTQKYNRSEPRKRKVNEIAEFGQVPDMATLVAFAIAGRMTVQAVRAMWYTAKGMMKIKRWASKTGHKIANSANPAPNYTQFESKRLDELSPKTKKAYSDKAVRAAGNEKKYADSYSGAAKADPSDPNYKKRRDQHKRKLANRKKGIEKANEKYDINKSKEERKSVLDERMFDRMFAGKAKKDDGTRSQADRTMKKYSPKKWAAELKRRQDAEKNGPAPVIKTQAHVHKKTDKGPKGVPHIHVADHNHKQFGG